MFLFERIVGFSTYMLALLFVCVILTKTNATCKSTLKFYKFCLCVMAVLYKPNVTADLYRIYNEVEFYSGMEFFYFWENYAIVSNVPIARLLYWCIGKTNMNFLLPVFSTLICYSFIFYVIEKTRKIFTISKRNVAYVLFFVMTTSIYISVIGGIRMMLALSMITFFFFRNTVENKKKFFDYIMCLMAVFIHAMSLAVIIICFVSILLDRNRGFARKIFWVIPVGAIGLFFTYRFRYVIYSIFEKFIYYISAARHYDIWEYIMGGLIVVLLLMFIYEYRYINKDEKYYLLNSLNIATVMCVIISLVFCFAFSIFYRFGGQLAAILSIPMMLVTLEKTNGKSSKIIRGVEFKSVFIVICVIVALISCTRGSLSSLKFFEL